MDTRRTFFSRLLGRALGEKDALHERPHLKLSALRELPHERLDRLIPKVDEQQVTIGAGDCLLRTSTDTRDVKHILTLGSVERAIFVRLDGSETIERTASEVAMEEGLDPGAAIEATRRVVLELVDAGVCYPTNEI